MSRLLPSGVKIISQFPAGIPVNCFSAEDTDLLLSFADKEYSFAAFKACQVIGGDIVLALLLGEGQQRNTVLLHESLDALDEGATNGLHKGRRHHRLVSMKTKERHHTAVMLQFWLVNVEVHAVDAFQFQGDVLTDDVGDRPWYTHGWLRLT